MRKSDVRKLPSMPAAGPSYPAGPYRFVDREYMVISYETDPDIVRTELPEPLEPIEQPLVHYEWIKMPDSSGFGSYTESGLVIPARFRGEEVNFVAQMYLDDDPPISAGREIWGFPKKYAHPKLEIVKDTLTGTLAYAGQLVALGTMGYKHESMAWNGERTTATLSKTQVNLKLVPGVDGRLEICQLVAYNLTDIVVKGSWIGPGRLHLARTSMPRSPTFRSGASSPPIIFLPTSPCLTGESSTITTRRTDPVKWASGHQLRQNGDADRPVPHSLNEIKIKPSQIFAGWSCDSRDRA